MELFATCCMVTFAGWFLAESLVGWIEIFEEDKK